MNLKLKITLFLLPLLYLASCPLEKEEGLPITLDSQTGNFIVNIDKSDSKRFAHTLLKEIYYWNYTVPANVTYSDYSNSRELFYDLLNEDEDRWSYTVNLQNYNTTTSNGTVEGYGCGLAFDANNELRITKLYEESPFYEIGIRRGDIIYEFDDENSNTSTDPYESYLEGSINDQLHADRITITFKTKDGTYENGSFSPEVISIDSVQKIKTFLLDDGRTAGYMAYTEFQYSREEELRDALDELRENGIDELIIDLRDNGGGALHTMRIISDTLLQQNHQGEIAYYATHNERYSYLDDHAQFTIGTLGSPLPLERVIFLTTGRTASASELLIKVLSPYLDIKIIGETTHGKYVGMYGFNDDSTMYFPICFASYNSLGEGDFKNGIITDSYIKDEIKYDYGDENDPIIAEALYYLNSADGSFTQGPSSPRRTARSPGDHYKEILPSPLPGAYTFIRD